MVTGGAWRGALLLAWCACSCDAAPRDSEAWVRGADPPPPPAPVRPKSQPAAAHAKANAQPESVPTHTRLLPTAGEPHLLTPTGPHLRPVIGPHGTRPVVPARASLIHQFYHFPPHPVIIPDHRTPPLPHLRRPITEHDVVKKPGVAGPAVQVPQQTDAPVGCGPIDGTHISDASTTSPMKPSVAVTKATTSLPSRPSVAVTKATTSLPSRPSVAVTKATTASPARPVAVTRPTPRPGTGGLRPPMLADSILVAPPFDPECPEGHRLDIEGKCREVWTRTGREK